jgi:hypothetical protein
VRATANGIIKLRELTDGLLVDSITSATSSIILTSAGLISDANNTNAVDLTSALGVNLTAGTSIDSIEMINSGATSTVTALAPGSISLNELSTDLRVNSVKSTGGSVSLTAARSIIDSLNTAVVDVTASTGIQLTATTGTIGETGSLEIDVTGTGLVLASANGNMRLVELTGNILLDSVTSSTGLVALTAPMSILDGNADADADIIALTANVIATAGTIGTTDAPVQTDVQPSVGAYSATALGDINFSETVGNFRAGLIRSTSGVIRVSSTTGIVNADALATANFYGRDIRLTAATLGTPDTRLNYEQPTVTGTAVTSFITSTTGDQNLKFVVSAANKTTKGVVTNVANLTSLISSTGVVDVLSDAPINVVSVESSTSSVKLASALAILDGNSSFAPDIVAITGVELNSTAGAIGEMGAGLELVVSPGGTVSGLASGSIWLNQMGDDFEVGSITSLTGRVKLYANKSILDAAGDSAADISAVSVDLKALTGSIGTSGKRFDIDSSRNGGVGLVTVSAATDVYMQETSGNLNVASIVASTGTVQLVSHGGILDGAKTVFTKISGNGISLVASAGAIGETSNDLEIDLQGTSRLTATASTNVFVTEKLGALRITNVTGTTGAVRLTVAEASGSGDDLTLESGNSIVAGTTAAIMAGDDINLMSGSTITAGSGSVTLTGDKPSLDAAGTTITINGTITAATTVAIVGNSQGATLVSAMDASYTLTTKQMIRTPVGSAAQTFSLTGFMAASLTGGAGDNNFNIGGWTGTTLTAAIDGGAGTDTVEATTDTDFTAANALLKRVGSGDATLLNIENGVFRGGAKANKFNMSGWTLSGTVDGAGTSAKIIDTIISNVAGSTTLVNNLLSRAGVSDLALAGFETAELTGSSGDDVFNVSGWSGTGKLLGGLGTDKIVANTDVADMLLTDVLLTRTGRGSLTLSGFEDAVLTGGAAANKFTVKGFQGTVKLDGGEGSDTYQVNLPATGTVAVNVNVEDTGTTGIDVLRTAAVAVAPTKETGNRRVSYGASSVIYTSEIETEILPIKGTLLLLFCGFSSPIV